MSWSRLVSFAALAALAAALGAGGPPLRGQDNDKALEAEKARVRKKVEDAVNRTKGKFVLVALSETTFHTGAVRKTVTLVPAQGKVAQRESTEFKIASPGTFLPVEKVEFEVKEGHDEAAKFLYEQMAKYVRAPQKGGKAARPKPGETPPPVGNFKVLGQFPDAMKAQAALERAKAAYLAQPRWESSGKEKD